MNDRPQTSRKIINPVRRKRIPIISKSIDIIERELAL